MDQNANADMISTAPIQDVSRNSSPRVANATDNFIQTAKAKKNSEPLIRWTKEMNFAVAIAAEHQKFLLGGDMKTRWAAVFLIINRVYKRFPDFVRDYPNGFSNPDKLRSQFGDRDREHEKHKGELTKKNWKFQLASCSTAEVQAMTAIADDVIKVEQELSLVKDSIVRDPGVNALRWVEYDANTTKAAKTKGTKRPNESSNDAQPDAPVKVTRRRRAAKEPVVKEDESDDQDIQQDEASGSPAPPVLLGRRRANETPAEANRRHQAAKRRVRGGARPVQHAVDDSYVNNNGEGVQEDVSAVTRNSRGSASYAYTMDNGSFLGPSNHFTTTARVNDQRGASHQSAESTPRPNTFDTLVLGLEAGNKLPMMHSSMVNFTLTDHPVVVVCETLPAAPFDAALDLSHGLDMFDTSQLEEDPAVPYQGPLDVDFVVGLLSQDSRVYSLAGQVCRVEFRDNILHRHKFADVMLCTPSTCGVCCGGELNSVALLHHPREDQHPMVRMQDITQLEGHGWCFLPVAPEDLSLERSYRSTGRPLEVVFSGGRQVMVEVFHQPADLSDPHVFNAHRRRD
jgi:hypothetical protein